MGETRINYRNRRRPLILAAVVLVAAACGGDTAAPAVAPESDASTTAAPTTTTAAPSTTAPPTTTTTSTTTTTTTTTAVPQTIQDLADVAAGDRPDGGWPIEAGVYGGSGLAAMPAFTVDEPLALYDYEPIVDFGRREAASQARVFFLEPVGVMPPAEIGTHPEHEPIVPINTEPIPHNLDDWLSAAAQVIVRETGDTNVGGAPARYWDLEVDSAAGETFDCGSGRDACVAFLVDATFGPFVLWEGFRFRVWELTGPGEGVWAFVQSASAQYADTVALAEALLADLAFSDS